MQKVVHASLNGNAYAIEEAGYQALAAYLGQAGAALAADPDREEILRDLEQAIADKCARHLAKHKSVVTAAEMEQALLEMGPVGPPEGAAQPAQATVASAAGPAAGPGAGGVPTGAPASRSGEAPDPAPAAAESAPGAGPAPAGGPPPRRLYRVLEGALLGGLCNGLGAYLQVDANVVRAVFVLLALLSHGAGVLLYLILLFVIPAAGTSEERAAARGLPFSAQALVDEAKKRAGQLGDELRGPWREAVAGMKREWDEAWRRDWQGSWDGATPPAAAGRAAYRERLAAGALLPLLAMVSAGLSVAALTAMASLVMTDRIFGWPVPAMPLWAGLLVLSVISGAVGQPFHYARRALRRGPRRTEALLSAWDALLWFGFAALFGWIAWHTSPDLKALVNDLPGAVERVVASWHRTG